MGDIGTNPRRVEVIPITKPVRQPAPTTPARPVPEPVREPAPV